MGETTGGTDLLDEARFTEDGKVHRHAWRGPLEEDARNGVRRARVPNHVAGTANQQRCKHIGLSFGR